MHLERPIRYKVLLLFSNEYQNQKVPVPTEERNAKIEIFQFQ